MLVIPPYLKHKTHSFLFDDWQHLQHFYDNNASQLFFQIHQILHRLLFYLQYYIVITLSLLKGKETLTKDLGLRRF
nr:MAG TPA: hypothetical protein [Bacteriophage sp.]